MSGGYCGVIRLLQCDLPLFALQGTELQVEDELEDGADYEENGRGPDEDDLDGKLDSSHGLSYMGWRQGCLPCL